jgi:hypothetical protein
MDYKSARLAAKIILRRTDGESYETIAAELGVTVEAAKELEAELSILGDRIRQRRQITEWTVTSLVVGIVILAIIALCWLLEGT